MRYEWVRVPVMKVLTMQNLFEHTPLDYYRFGEYPRFIRPPYHEEPQWRWEKRAVPTPRDPNA